MWIHKNKTTLNLPHKLHYTYTYICHADENSWDLPYLSETSDTLIAVNVLWKVSFDSLWFKAVCCVCVLAGGEREEVIAISKWVMNVCKGDGLDMGGVKNVSSEGWLYRRRVRQI